MKKIRSQWHQTTKKWVCFQTYFLFYRGKTIYFILRISIKLCNVFSSLRKLVLIKLSIIKWIIFCLDIGASQSNFKIFLSLQLRDFITFLKFTYFRRLLETTIRSLRNGRKLLKVKIFILLIRSLVAISQFLVDITWSYLYFLGIIYLCVCMR